MTKISDLTVEEMESLRFLRDGVSSFAGRSGNIKIDTSSEVPLIVKAIDCLDAIIAAGGEGDQGASDD